MKKIIVFAVLLIIIGACITGCYKDVNISPVTASTPPQATSYKNDIQPIFTTSCALSGCHVAGAQVPDLEPAASYQDLVNGGYVNTLIPNQSTLYIMINGEMKVHISSAADRQKIYDWIRTGAIDN
ncbi:hypothetical protein [Mucilaginibacter sp.]